MQLLFLVETEKQWYEIMYLYFCFV